MLMFNAWIHLILAAIISAQKADNYCDTDGCKDGTPKVILFWNTFFGIKDYNMGFGREPFIDSKCKVTNCVLTADKKYESTADAVIFHHRNVHLQMELPTKRSPHQRYIFFLLESPYHQGSDVTPFNGYFNWTMTYRSSSDVQILYGQTLPGAGVYDKTYEHLRITKTKKVAWFVSNCNTNSKRETYVEELQKYIDVDIYGKCGNHTCPDYYIRDARMHPDCYTMLEENYKFYLSFENVFCEDYVTEKAYNILKLWVVPIVMGAANYEEMMPPNSVVNVKDFKSPKLLAEYLNHLADNEEEYLKYFAWKQTHHVSDMTEAFHKGFCDLCEKLNKHNLKPKTHNDLARWWGKDRICERQTQWKFG